MVLLIFNNKKYGRGEKKIKCRFFPSFFWTLSDLGPIKDWELELEKIF